MSVRTFFMYYLTNLDMLKFMLTWIFTFMVRSYGIESKNQPLQLLLQQ